MTTKHSNEFTLTCASVTTVTYIANSAQVSSGQPFDVPPTISNQGSGKWNITFESGRHKTDPIANRFKSIAGGSKYTMITASSGDRTPDQLNFFFGLTLGIQLPNGVQLDPVTVYLGQGSNSSNNNWWFGCDALINLDGNAVLLATQSGQIAWQANIDISNSALSLDPVVPDKPSSFSLLDVWGEGRIDDGGFVTGFSNSLNLNLYSQTISNGTQKGQSIPQQVQINDYNGPNFPIADGAVQFVTLMGAPIVDVTAREIVRVLNPTTGVVVLYDPDTTSLNNWEMNMGSLVYKPTDTLESPFNEISISNPRVYGFSGVTDNVEDKDEL